MLKISNLKKSYNAKKTVLIDINAEFDKGSITGIVGENGAGKTTLFNCMSNLIDFEGEIYWDGKPLNKQNLSYLNTHPQLITFLKGREYLQYYCQANKILISEFDQWNLFDLPLDEYASDYSTGMKKKLALTAILLDNKPIYLLDEPFNGIDIQSNILFKKILQKLKLRNKTIILSSHIFESMTEICDTIIHLKEGTLKCSYGPEEFDILEKLIHNNQNDDILNQIEKLW